jgi:hypothetical protein
MQSGLALFRILADKACAESTEMVDFILVLHGMQGTQCAEVLLVLRWILQPPVGGSLLATLSVRSVSTVPHSNSHPVTRNGCSQSHVGL